MPRDSWMDQVGWRQQQPQDRLRRELADAQRELKDTQQELDKVYDQLARLKSEIERILSRRKVGRKWPW